MGTQNEQKHCPVCGRLYEIGYSGICRACQWATGPATGSAGKRAQPRPKSAARKKRKRLRCDCGKPAVTVLPVRVGENGIYQARLPLCADCLELERSYGLVGSLCAPARTPQGDAQQGDQ